MALTDFQRYVNDVQASGGYANWARDNHGGSGFSVQSPKPGSEVANWYAFRDTILAGQRPSLPTMQTAFGKSLVDAGELYLTGLPAVKVTVTGKTVVGQTLTAATS